MSTAKDLKYVLLFDFYGDLLTERQRLVMDEYYNQDLSILEIATLRDVTRQSVWDTIRRAQTQLLRYEEQLSHIAKLKRLEERLDSIAEKCQEAQSVCKDTEVNRYLAEILEDTTRRELLK